MYEKDSKIKVLRKSVEGIREKRNVIMIFYFFLLITSSAMLFFFLKYQMCMIRVPRLLKEHMKGRKRETEKRRERRKES